MVQPMSDTPPAPQPQPAPQPAAPTLTDADVKRAATQAKKEAAASMAADLGCTVEEAKSILGQVRAAGDAQKSEAQRNLEAATAAKAEAEAIRAEAAAERLAAKVERKLLAAGVPEAALTRVSRLVNVAPDADDAAITAEVEAAKTELPQLFAASASTPPAPGLPPVKPPAPTGMGGKTMEDLGRENARRLGIKIAS